ncbi:MAG: type II toxin-antitoxin system prevent-host-death family antitoxin [Acidobacteriia bacterium]|nr:type II toxin-antitoxin system prevent-host-death family antitoxin [Terriglobia bacterium]
MKKRVINVTELKAKFSACLDEAERGASITILKNGRPFGFWVQLRP